jgi:hypothetical protein
MKINVFNLYLILISILSLNNTMTGAANNSPVCSKSVLDIIPNAFCSPDQCVNNACFDAPAGSPASKGQLKMCCLNNYPANPPK